MLFCVSCAHAGRGPLSGQPVLSEAAQQEHLTPSDIRTAAQAAGSAEPQLKPPKPRKGLTGWMRRHMSLNVAAPARAGKAGAGAMGCRGCFGGKKQQKEGEGERDKQLQGEQGYQSWMEQGGCQDT